MRCDIWPNLNLDLPYKNSISFPGFQGAFGISEERFWPQRRAKVIIHSTLVRPTNMAEAWRIEGAIVKLHDHPVNEIDSIAMIKRVFSSHDGGGYLVKVMDAEMRPMEIVVPEERLGRVAPPQGDINPTEEPMELDPDYFPAKPVCSFAKGSPRDPGNTRGIQTSVEMSEADVRRLDKNARIAAVEQAAKARIKDVPFSMGCVRAGKEAMETCGSTNIIKRFAKYVQGYAAAVGQGVTHEDVEMWLAKSEYWADTMDIAETAFTARDNRTPMVFIIVSKCAADDYCAQMRTDENNNVRQHRVTLNTIRDKLSVMFPANLIILLDVPATLFGCARTKPTERGYKGCKKSSAAGKEILRHMLMVLLPTAAACGFMVGGIATICHDITEDWLFETIHNETMHRTRVIQPPPMLYGSEAYFPRRRLQWSDVHMRVVVGRGPHYVFMHLEDFPDVADICVRLTAIALGINRRDESIGIGSDDHQTLVKLAVLFHTLAGARGRIEWRATRVKKQLHDVNPEKYPNAPSWNDALHGSLADIDVGDFEADAEGGESDPESDWASNESDE